MKNAIQETVRQCTACSLSGTHVPINGCVPSLNGVAVITEAPSAEEVKAGKPLYSDVGRYLASLLAEYVAGTRTMSFMHAVACQPVTLEGHPRAASNQDLEACWPMLKAQMGASGARYFLLVGSVPLRRFLAMPVTEAHGHPFMLARGDHHGPIGYTVCHPAAAMRNGDVDALLRADLKRFGEMVLSDDWLSYAASNCRMCGAAGGLNDRGFAYCDDHYREER